MNTCTLISEFSLGVINEFIGSLHKLSESFFHGRLLLLSLKTGKWFLHICIITPWEIWVIPLPLIVIVGVGVELMLVVGHIIYLFG